MTLTSTCATVSFLTLTVTAHAAELDRSAPAASAAKVAPLEAQVIKPDQAKCGLNTDATSCSKPAIQCRICAFRLALAAREVPAPLWLPDDAQ
jgi:hypothetical protein